MERLRWDSITAEERIPHGKKGNNSYRSEVESDYYRIITSASFRRLQDKTQVFPLDKSDFVRTRLTHSLEVSSIAKLIGKQVCTQIIDQHLEDDELLPDTLKVVEILNCAGLLHDIGNPPFGHFGETAIRNWFIEHLPLLSYKGKKLNEVLDEQQRYDFEHFEGNAQALRIITKLHRLSGNYGMHLTSGVLDSIIKYPSSSLDMVKELEKEKEKSSLLRKKIGYFQSETKQFTAIKNETHTWECRNPLTFILEAGDDLAYTFADLEDGYKKGLYSYDELMQAVELGEDKAGKEKLVYYLEEGKKLVAMKEEGFDPYQHAITTWLTHKQLYCISRVSAAFIEHYEEIMNGTFDQELIAISSEGKLIKSLKDFSYHHIYNEGFILKLELMGNEVISFLLDRFVSALIYYDSDVEISEIQSKYIALMSRNYLDNYHISTANIKDEHTRLYHRLLLVTDFISGMSDSYAQSLYRELKGI